MIWIKLIMLFAVFALSICIGIMISKKFSNRVRELKDMKNALNMFETKIKFTYESVPTIFEEISRNIPNSMGDIFKRASRKMDLQSAGDAWLEAIDEKETNLLEEDKSVLINLRKTFRKNRFGRAD